uniref:Uncharacterized protein LOC111107972 n=1 Tax=Crassostrea virginica TaxID=6565 RepID=A0A8B8B8T2_CRAVI|nr:uncharacterized protein LOC111107972 [Crassostrea virginica]
MNLGENETDELTESLTFIKRKANYVGVFDLQNKDGEQFSAIVGELVHRTWSSERASKEKDSSKDHAGNCTTVNASSYCISTRWARDEIRWRRAKTLPTSWFSSFTSPFSLPLDFFFGFSEYLESRESHSENPELKEKLDETLLLLALTSNRTDYIETLLDLNISLSEENINNLYRISIKKEGKRSSMIKKHQYEKDSVFQWIITDIGGQHSKYLIEGTAAHLHAQKIVKNMLQYKETVDPRLEAACYSKRRKAYIKRQFSLQSILLWSLFFNKVNISTMIWKRVANQLYTGLVGTVILQKLSEVARLKDELIADEISDHSVIFKKRVCNMMDTLSKKNKEDTFTILDSLETVWKIQSKPIFFAYEFQLYDVIAHPTSVAWMNQKWYNGLIPNWKRFIWNIKVLCLLHAVRYLDIIPVN